MLLLAGTETNRINTILERGSGLSEKEFLELEIARWKKSAVRKAMLDGERYYRYDQDILRRKRTVIGKDGLLQEVQNLPNNKLIDNQYAKMVDQKANYLLGKPFIVNTDNKAYEKALGVIFDRKFHKMMNNLGKDSLKGAIGWLYPYYDDGGKLCFKRFAPFEILPFWSDAEHTQLDMALRLYEVVVYSGRIATVAEKVELYKITGIERYALKNGVLIPDAENPGEDYLTYEDAAGKVKAFNWGRLPLLPFKYNDREIPLISKVKGLQDAINEMISDFENIMQEDARNTILVIKNYDGQNLDEFRHNLATYGAVKVRTIDGADGGVEALQVEVNANNYQIILELLKKALIENAMGYDAKDDRLGGTPNQMNLQSMYSDIDLDANGMETEYQAAFEDLLWFINAHLANTGQGDFSAIEVKIQFDRDMLMNESEIITDAKNSMGLISNETIVANHPWVLDAKAEMERIRQEKQASIDEYANAFSRTGPAVTADEGGDKLAQ